MTPRRTDDLRIRAKRLFDWLKAEYVDGMKLIYDKADRDLMDEIIEGLEPGPETERKDSG